MEALSTSTHYLFGISCDFQNKFDDYMTPAAVTPSENRTKRHNMLLYIALSVAYISLNTVDAAKYASIVGYPPDNDVKQHLRLDLDQRNLSTVAVAPVDLVAAYTAYSVGKKCLLILLHDKCRCCLSVSHVSIFSYL